MSEQAGMLVQAKSTLRHWRYEGDALKDTRLVQKLMDAIRHEFALPLNRKQDLELVLLETITNSIDHGILELDSMLKKDPQGFEQYFSLRNRKLDSLEGGFVEVSIDQIEADSIRIVVQDSGEGFPYPSGELTKMPESLLLAYGRGLPIIHRLCQSVTHIGNGNCVVLEFCINP